MQAKTTPMSNAVKRRRRQKPPMKIPQRPAEAKREHPSVAEQGLPISWLDPEGLLPGPYHYNSSIIRRDDGLWLAYRDQDTKRDSRIGVVRLDEEFRAVENLELSLPVHWKQEQREDPRLFWFRGKIWLSYGCWDNNRCAAIAVVELDRGWKVVREFRARYATNWSSEFQKNWCFFESQQSEDLHCVYSPSPHEVVAFDRTGKGRLVARDRGIAWGYGLPRGGTPPVLYEGRYWSFFHSRLMTPHNRFRYFMGAYALNALTFKPELVTPDPLLSASADDPNLKFLPLVVFPCGAVLDEGAWTVSLGVNDVRTAFVKISHKKLRERMHPC